MDWGGVLREGCSLRGKYVYDGKRYVKDASGGVVPCDPDGPLPG